MAESVEDICARLVKDSKLVASCNGYLAAVAATVQSGYKVEGLTALFAGTADVVRGRFADEARTVPPFVCIGRDPGKATSMAGAGHFVVGGLTSGEMTYVGRDKVQRTATMGHVVVVVPGGPSKPCIIRLANGKDQPARGGYPYCYQGAAHALYRFSVRTQVDAVFPSLLLDKVTYAYVPLT